VSNIAQSSQWANEGQRLRNFKATEPPPSGGPTPGNAGDWAYQSNAIDITGDGDYVLDFGPVDNDFDYPNSPTSVAFNFPSDTEFTILPSGSVGVVTVDGKRYFRVHMRVTNFKESYSQMTAWAY
jgi:hypothetical protein